MILTSPFAVLLIAIQNQLKTINLAGSPTGTFGTNDQDLGQLEDASRGINRPPVSFPCALTDIEDAEFTQLGDNAERGKVNVCIRLGFPPFSNTSSITPAPYRNDALYYYEIEQAVYLAFQGWTPGVTTTDDTTTPHTTFDLGDIFGKFIRVRAVTERRNDLIRVRALYFTLTIDDYSALQQPTIQNGITTSVTVNF
jgi:hypothetical protein